MTGGRDTVREMAERLRDRFPWLATESGARPAGAPDRVEALEAARARLTGRESAPRGQLRLDDGIDT